MRELTRDNLKVKIFETREEMGKVAADDVSSKINELLEEKDTINIVFAAAPSQNDFLASLRDRDLEWNRIKAFHMDEYVGLDPDAPQLFGNFLKEKIFGKVPFKEVHYFNGQADDLEAECQRYAKLLKDNPTDICILGIGENTHLAFCDPHVAYFDDPKDVKVVDLDEKNRQQQVNDGMFETIDDVPTHALTMTIPALMRATYTYTIVPTEAKADAVNHTLNSEVQEKYPSTRLRQHPNGILYTDEAGASKL
ncbi:MAG: glucosamine-6-phosphate deaminase [Balneolaceae bacterium]|nr:glucosamine-6-phosphate deaminase [Balneolaceae bacterium]